MIKTISIILFILLTVITIAFIDDGIHSQNMNFYQGKDNGYFVRFESIVILNTIFYIVLTFGKQKKFKNYLIQASLGFITAIILSVVCYILFSGTNYNGLTFHIVTIFVCYTSYFGLIKLKRVTN